MVVWYLSMILHFIQNNYTNDSLSMLRLCLVMKEVVSEKVFDNYSKAVESVNEQLKSGILQTKKTGNLSQILTTKRLVRICMVIGTGGGDALTLSDAAYHR